MSKPIKGCLAQEQKLSNRVCRQLRWYPEPWQAKQAQGGLIWRHRRIFRYIRCARCSGYHIVDTGKPTYERRKGTNRPGHQLLPDPGGKRRQ